MAQHKSAEKRARQSLKANLANRSYMSKVKTEVKKFLTAVSNTSTTAADLQKLFSNAQSVMMKAATKGVVHKNNASRHIARLSHMMAKKAAAKSA